jgi:CubicO group peptidase (beta-lactamase class C family)
MGACDDVGGALDVFQDDSLQFEPGQRYRYSGAGWTLVGAAVQAAAGRPYQDVMRHEVFEPLGMDATVPGRADATLSDGTRPYDPHPFRTVRLSHAVDYSCQLPAEGYLSTPTDLVRFGLGLLDGRALSDETRQVLWTPRVLAFGSSARYGLGWSVGTVRFDDDAPSSPMVQNSSSVVGGRTALLVYPEQDMVVAVSGNLSYRSVSSLASDLAEGFFAASGG